MTNQTNGNSESLNLKVAERIKQVEDSLDEFSRTLGLNFIKYNSSIQDILSLDENELKGLDANECGEYSYRLSNYALYIQKEYNRLLAKKNWVKANLDVLIARNKEKFNQYMKYEEKLSCLCIDNSAATELNKILVDTSIKVDELSFIATRLESLAIRLDELHKTRRRQT